MTFSFLGEQLSTQRPRVRLGEQGDKLRGIHGQLPEAHLQLSELVLDHAERVFELGPYLCLGVLDFAPRLVRGTALTQLFVGVMLGRNLPDNFTPCRLGGA